MSKKETAILSEQNQSAVEQASEKPVTEQTSRKSGGNASGIYCYIGPTIRGLIQHGKVFRGSKAEALEAAEKAIEKQPLVKTLIVSGDALPMARLNVKTPGNALHQNYQRIAGKH